MRSLSRKEEAAGPERFGVRLLTAALYTDFANVDRRSLFNLSAVCLGGFTRLWVCLFLL